MPSQPLRLYQGDIHFIIKYLKYVHVKTDTLYKKILTRFKQ